MIIAALFIVESPEKMGLRPYGEDTPSNEYSAPKQVSWSMAEAFRTRAFLLICAIWIFASMTTHLIVIHLPPFAEGMGMNKGEAAALLGLVGGIGIVARIFGGFCGDKLGWRNALIASAFLGAIVLVLLSWSRTAWMIYSSVLLYGFLFGVRLTVIPGLIGSYYGTRNLPEIMSYLWSAAALAGLVGPLVGGLLFDLMGSYLIALLTGAGWYVVVGILALMLRPPIKDAPTHIHHRRPLALKLTRT